MRISYIRSTFSDLLFVFLQSEMFLMYYLFSYSLLLNEYLENLDERMRFEKFFFSYTMNIERKIHLLCKVLVKTMKIGGDNRS